MPNPLSYIGRALRGLWWLLDATRRTLLNLLLLLVLVALAWGLVRGMGGPGALQPKTTLVLDIGGRIAEQRTGGGRTEALQRVRGQGEAQTRLRDVLAVLDGAAKDPAITQAVLALDDMGGAGLATLREVAAAIERFKAAGKPVYAWGSDYDQRSYFLAAHATEVWLHPMGSVSVEGYGRPRSYYKDLLDKVGVSANVVRAGKFKNANETFAANAPSPETLEADAALYGGLWSTWTAAVEKARKLPAGSVAQAIESLPGSLVAAGGDGARWAVQQKWVDRLKTRDEMRKLVAERGAADEQTFRQVSLQAYLSRLPPQRGGDTIAVVVAEGGISNGSSGPGGIGGRSTSELIRQARDDKAVKALVLRVNSGGGSAFGSELVRRELQLTREAGKPVVVSMGDVAASGGYWISMAADEVIADEATITGSIGVVAMLPTAQGAFDKLGVHTAGTTTTWLGGAYDLRRGVEPRFVELVQASIDHIYRDFTGMVAKARKRTPEQIDAVAQGRVWVGKDALRLGLVDRLGSLDDALKSAAAKAKLTDGWRPDYFEVPQGRLERLLERLGVHADLLQGTSLPGLQATAVALGLLPPAASALSRDLAWLAELGSDRRPYEAVTHCLCEAP